MTFEEWAAERMMGSMEREFARDAWEAATKAAYKAHGEPPTDSYVQTVPDKCDRIVWRNRYYHLPLASPAIPEGDVVVTWDESQTRILAVTRQDDEGRVLSVLAAAPNSIPEGWQLVPKEATEAMVMQNWDCFPDDYYCIWQAMLAAAPKPEDKP